MKNLKTSFFVVHSQSRLAEIIHLDYASDKTDCQESLANLRNIDFSNYTLLIGKKVVTAVTPQLLSEQVNKHCDPNKLTYNLKILNGGYTAMGIYKFAVLIPKQSGEMEIDFEITTQNRY